MKLTFLSSKPGCPDRRKAKEIYSHKNVSLDEESKKINCHLNNRIENPRRLTDIY